MATKKAVKAAPSAKAKPAGLAAGKRALAFPGDPFGGTYMAPGAGQTGTLTLVYQPKNTADVIGTTASRKMTVSLKKRQVLGKIMVTLTLAE